MRKNTGYSKTALLVAAVLAACLCGCGTAASGSAGESSAGTESAAVSETETAGDTEAPVSGQFLRVHTVNDLHPQVEGVVADIFDADLLADNITGDDVNALLRERSSLVSHFVDLQLYITGGHNIGCLADDGIVSK